jgi:hypothetical protein
MRQSISKRRKLWRTVTGTLHPAYNANQIVTLPKNLLRLIISDRAIAIMGIRMSCSTKIYDLFPHSNKINLFTNKKDGGLTGAHLIFLVTAAMASSWTTMERRKVTNMARARARTLVRAN